MGTKSGGNITEKMDAGNMMRRQRVTSESVRRCVRVRERASGGRRVRERTKIRWTRWSRKRERGVGGRVEGRGYVEEGEEGGVTDGEEGGSWEGCGSCGTRPSESGSSGGGVR